MSMKQNVAMIGGADAPIGIFVTEFPFPIGAVAAAVAIVLVVGIVLFLHHKNR